jgi:ligand-binding SRPBCC domain-containing protein
MKKAILSLACALVTTTVAFGQASTSTTTTTTGGGTSVSTTKTTTSTGTIHEYTPGSAFVVKETSGPVKYRYGKKVTYVTKKGKTLTDDEVRTRIKVGSPVSVHYGTEGTDRVIERVEIDD